MVEKIQKLVSQVSTFIKLKSAPGPLVLIVPGTMKVMNFGVTAEYMAAHGMNFIPLLLTLTIILQLTGVA